jgi:hypothetical protein
VDVVVVIPCGSLSRPSGLFQYSDDLPTVHVCMIYTQNPRVKRPCVKNVYEVEQGVGRACLGACGDAGRLESGGEKPEPRARKCNKMLKGVRVDTESIRKYTPGRVCPCLSTAAGVRGDFEAVWAVPAATDEAREGRFQAGTSAVLGANAQVQESTRLAGLPAGGAGCGNGGAHPWCAGATFRAGSAHRGAVA